MNLIIANKNPKNTVIITISNTLERHIQIAVDCSGKKIKIANPILLRHW